MDHVGEWFDQVIMLPDYSADYIVEIIQAFLTASEPETSFQNKSHDDDNDDSVTDFPDDATIGSDEHINSSRSQVEEVFVMPKEEEIKVEVNEDDYYTLPSSPLSCLNQNCDFSSLSNEKERVEHIKSCSRPSFPSKGTIHVVFPEKNFICMFCKMTFRTLEEKKKHEESYIDGNGQFMCEAVLMKNKQSADLTKSETKNDENYVCNFEKCGVILKSLKTLKGHIKRVHIVGDVKTYSCYFCADSFKGRRSYLMHKESCIGVPNNYKCPQAGCFFKCGVERTIMSHFKEHKRLGNCDFSCEICGKNFTTTQGKIAHLRRNPGPHAKPKPKPKLDLQLPCPICFRVLKTKNSLNFHLRTFHDEEGRTKFKCDKCTRGFSTHGKLKQHLLVHSDERNFVCTTCGKKFRSPQYLRRHNKIHTGLKPHKCSFCGKGFINPDKVRRHELIHTGVMDFSCTSCGKKFNQKGNLVTHEKKCTGYVL